MVLKDILNKDILNGFPGSNFFFNLHQIKQYFTEEKLKVGKYAIFGIIYLRIPNRKSFCKIAKELCRIEIWNT